MLDRVKNIAAVAAFACLVGGFGFALWQASHQHPKQSPREESAKNHEANPNKRAERSSAVQINCDPNCTADGADHQGAAISQYLEKIDPLTIVTLMLVIVVIVQVRDSRRSSERQLRAYVMIKRVAFERPDTTDGDHQEWPILVVVQNSGGTPAYNVIIKAECYLGDRKPMNEIFVLSEAADVSPQSIIPPGDRHVMRLGGLEPGYSKFMAAQRTERYCYVWGRIDYIDTFSRKHFTTFQMWHGFIAVNQFGFSLVGNTTDDEFPEVWWRRLFRKSDHVAAQPNQSA